MGFILELLFFFAGFFVFFKFVKPAKAPFAAATIATVIITLCLWLLPLVFKAIGALITIAIMVAVLGLIFFLWKKLQAKI